MYNLIFSLQLPGSFSFCYETLDFLSWIILLLLGLLTCLRGYKVIRTASLIAAALAFGLAGYRLSDPVTNDPAFKLIFFLCFIFLGLVVLQLVWSALSIPVKLLRLDRLFFKIRFFVTALLGAGLFSGLLFFRVFRNPAAAACTCAALTVLGSAVQARHQKKEVPAHTYDDLFRMLRRTETERLYQ